MSKEWGGSTVMDEFMKIAAESGLITTNLKPEGKDFVGNPSKETPVKDHRRYEPTEEYGVTKEEDLVQKAHPKKVQVADAMGEGGVVENLNEQQEKSIDIATKMPHGALVGVHAALINELIKVATQLDESGKHKEAARIDQTIERLARLPFVDSHLYKKAIGWMLPVIGILSAFAPNVINWMKTERRYPGAKRTVKMQGGKLVGGKGRAASLVLTGVSILGMLGNKVTSLQEGIRQDTQDLLDVLGKAESDAARKAFGILRSFAPKLLQTNLGSEKGIKEFSSAVEKANAALPALEKHISMYTQLEDPSVTGFGLSGRVEAKFEDFKTSLIQASKTIAQLTSVGAKANENAIQDLKQTPVGVPLVGEKDYSIQFLQQVLFNRGFPRGETWKGQVTGIMDENTIAAAKALEGKLDQILQGFAQKEGLSGSFKGQIVQDNHVIIDPHRLLKILTLTEKYISE